MQRVASFVLNSFENDSRVLKTGLFLRRNNFDVTVFALHDNGLSEIESVSGLPVERIRLFSRSWPKKKIVQLIKFVEWILAAIWRARHVNIAHCNDLNTLPVGIALKLLSFGRVKIVYDAHEFESNQIPDQNRYSIILLQLIERILIRFADSVITVSDGIADEYARLYGIPKPALVLNCPPYREIVKRNLFREKLGINPEQTIFLYQGSLSKGRGIESLLEAFADLDSDSVIVFMGYGPLEPLIKERALACENVFFHPAVSPDILLDYTGSADFGISTIENKCLSYYYCLPNKMFEYIMAGLPVIASNLHEMKKMVEGNGIGVVAEDNTVLGLRNAIARARAMSESVISENIKKVRKNYCWEKQEEMLLKVYHGM